MINLYRKKLLFYLLKLYNISKDKKINYFQKNQLVAIWQKIGGYVMNKSKIVEPLENAKDFVEDRVTPLTILFGVVACLLGVGLIYLAYLLISHFSHSDEN